MSIWRTITEVAMKMHNPPHPGEIIKALCLEPLGLSVTRAAEAFGVSRKAFSAVLNGRAGVSPEMAVRLRAHSELRQRVGLRSKPNTICSPRSERSMMFGSKNSRRPNHALQRTRRSCHHVCMRKHVARFWCR
jgi:addiction module HigA family antidote